MAFLLSGIPASGKSTVAQLSAERLPLFAHVRGGLFRCLIVPGMRSRPPMLDAEGLAQSRLHQGTGAAVADSRLVQGLTTEL